MRQGSGVLIAVAFGVALCLGPPAGEGASCTVPGDYPSIAAALAEVTCDPIVLGSQTYQENLVVSRPVTVQGVSSAGTVVEGQVQVVAGTVVLNNLRVDTTSAALAGRFHQALVASSGARLSGTDLVVVHKALLFGDGFESGNTTAWFTTEP